MRVLLKQAVYGGRFIIFNFQAQGITPYNILTKGSRGDIQPYISLCQALKKDGHTCRIASHGEYKPWIEDYGIEFVEIGGSPADVFLNYFCLQFWGWLDNLLVSSYKACKGTNFLIESPLTMSENHIAEVLEILYFRAFTMPFPDHKMGSGYNYMT
ncbi:hypothetical protein PPACK8108_LOCUS22522 [Phakopsora pachyrhizi]|uniref:Glycosyltransferase family 28 N-terminal domain-containing protein n=1 Tax=Phakopsora pachyrhizi TaxID=170000 RepID=A0AAV0BMW0_PHAPC|nr:hypothetical protein PPACK8108_LOCUS22522 [Phakopsora pachyrhizi]